MFFQPTVKDFVIAHPVPLVFLWCPIAGFFAYRINQNWASLDQEHQLAVVLMFSAWGVVLLLSLPKVWWHLYQKRKHKLAGIDPELLSRQRRKRGGVVLSLLAVALFEYVTYFLSTHTEAENPPQYMTAIGLAGSLSLLPFVLFYRCSRSWSSYAFLALVFLFGVAGMWQVAHPAELFANYPELVELIRANNQLSYYLIATAMLCTFLPPLLLFVTLTLKAGSWLKRHTDKPIILPDKAFAVTWCLPVPRRSPDARAAILPDYCKQLFTAEPRPKAKTYSTADMSILTSGQSGAPKPAA